MTMSSIVSLRVVRQPGLLVLGIPLCKGRNGEAAAKERGGEDHVPFKRADVLLFALVDGLQTLDHCVNVIKGVLDLVVCIGWR